MLHEKHREWLTNRRIDPTLAEKFGLDTVHRSGGYWLAIPYLERGQVVNHKYRLTSEKKHMMDSGAPLCLWNHDVLLRPETVGGTVIITEGEWDALSVIQCGFENCMSVPNGAAAGEQKLEYIERSLDLLAKVGKFILATDADSAGLALREELARRLGPARCMFLEYPDGCKDLSEVLQLSDGFPDSLVRTINAAKPYPVQGMYRLSDIPEPPPFKEYSFGIPGLSEYISVVPGTLTVLTGYASHGKTSLSMSIITNLIKSGMNVAVGSFETAPKPVMQTRLRAAMMGCAEYEVAKRDTSDIDLMMDQRLTILFQSTDDDDGWDIDHVLDLAAGAVIRDGIRLLFLDPWNEIEHKRGSDSETDYTGRALRAVKRFARDFGVAVWIVAHPSKPEPGKQGLPGLYSISGSAHWANKPDYGIVSHRPQPDTNMADIHVVKVRMGLPGKRGKLTLAYDWRDSSYHNVATGEAD